MNFELLQVIFCAYILGYLTPLMIELYLLDKKIKQIVGTKKTPTVSCEGSEKE
jgi:hypothetical protein